MYFLVLTVITCVLSVSAGNSESSGPLTMCFFTGLIWICLLDTNNNSKISDITLALQILLLV